jgi:hypothetical protein
MKHTFIIIVVILLSALLLLLVVKGQPDNHTTLKYQSDYSTVLGGPFEGSNSTARYALTEAIVKYHTVFYNLTQAQFATPDLVSYKGKYFSLFTPGVSFAAVPLYLLGLRFNLPQLGTYTLNLIFSLINVFLIYKLSKKIGAGTAAASLAGFLFLFGTNALSYALTLTQHPGTTALLLGSLLLCTSKRTVLSNLFLGALAGISLLFDIPNAFLLLPIFIFLTQAHFKITSSQTRFHFDVNPSLIFLAVGAIPFVLAFAIYNRTTTGSYTKVSQLIGRTDTLTTASASASLVEHESRPTTTSEPKRFALNTRSILNGLYTLVVSDERSWWYYSPIVFVGLLGWILAYKRPQTQALSVVALSIAAVNVVVYSMFGDPWGGWAFGPRYLIPAAGILSVGIGLVVQTFRRNAVFILALILLAFYSIAINVLGAITTSNIPPKVEAIQLSVPIPYTYTYNLQLLTKTNLSSSLMYNLFATNLTALQYYFICLAGISLVCFGIMITCLFDRYDH